VTRGMAVLAAKGKTSWAIALPPSAAKVERFATNFRKPVQTSRRLRSPARRLRGDFSVGKGVGKWETVVGFGERDRPAPVSSPAHSTMQPSGGTVRLYL
jgi:hypothetical protein